MAVLIFLDCSGQWHRDGAGVPRAIQRTHLETSMRLWPVPQKKRSDTFHRIKVMERVAADWYDKESKRQQQKSQHRKR